MIGFGKHRRRRRHRDDLGRAAENIAGHVCKPRRSRSFDFRHPNGSSFYAYALTWTSGSLALAGDCGEMILTHYQALAELKSGLEWAQSSDADYLLGKSNLQRVLDKDATVQWLIDDANENAIGTMQYHRDDVQRWRAERPDPYAWRDPADFPDWYDDWLRARPQLEVYEFTKTSSWPPYGRTTTMQPEDGFEAWNRLRRQFCDRLPVEAIYGAKGRHQIREAIEDWISGIGPDAIGEMTYCTLSLEAGPCESWPFSALQAVECVRQGARMALEALAAEEAAKDLERVDA